MGTSRTEELRRRGFLHPLSSFITFALANCKEQAESLAEK
jgi:hypothetical protein